MSSSNMSKTFSGSLNGRRARAASGPRAQSLNNPPANRRQPFYPRFESRREDGRHWRGKTQPDWEDRSARERSRVQSPKNPGTTSQQPRYRRSESRHEGDHHRRGKTQSDWADRSARERPGSTKGFGGQENGSRGAVRGRSSPVRGGRHFSFRDEKQNGVLSTHSRQQSRGAPLSIPKPTTPDGAKVGGSQNRAEYQPKNHLQVISDPTIQRLVDFDAKIRLRGRDGTGFPILVKAARHNFHFSRSVYFLLIS